MLSITSNNVLNLFHLTRHQKFSSQFLQKQQEFNKTKEIIVLDHKRSNAINIAITKFPPARTIKIAISKMDSTVITREAIEKLMNLLPTMEETNKIQEAQSLNPDLPLGSAEQFLLTLSSISEIAARLKLWSFKLDFENIEKEIAEPLMDLKVVNTKSYRFLGGILKSFSLGRSTPPHERNFQKYFVSSLINWMFPEWPSCKGLSN